MENKFSPDANSRLYTYTEKGNGETSDAVAIIGMGCRFPGGVNDPNEFWEFLKTGRDVMTDVPEDRWNVRLFYDPDVNKPGKMYVKVGGFLKQNIDEFDAFFFGITPREADCMDPQQRLLLEVAWESLEDAGIAHDSLAGTDTGVYVGAFTLDNKLTQMSGANRDRIGPHTAVGSTMTILSNRLSYILDLRGPSLSVDTACSSSLVAFHYACESIRNGECSLALAGGVNVIHRPEYTIAMCKGQFLAPDGHCKSFDARANGYARGEGGGILVLKSLSAALRDGDRIHAVVRGTGVNQDGRTSGITVPNGESQEALVRYVCRKGGVDPHAIGYVEAHGTGTPIGDPAEAGALGRALGQGRDADKPLAISSVKANIGHLEAASGVAGLIKTVLCLKHEQIPPLANLREPTPNIPFDALGLRLPTRVEPFTKPRSRAYAAVNSFGYGGTNAHALLEKAPETSIRGDSSVKSRRGPWLLPLSARSESALKSTAKQIVDYVTANSDIDHSDLCHTASARRSHHEYRLAVLFSSRAQLLEQLQLFIDGQPSDLYVTGKTIAGAEKSDPVFVFTGMGPQWWGMGRELMQHNEVFRHSVETIDRLFAEEAGWSILEEMRRDEANSRMSETHIAQPANFVVQAGLLATLETYGLKPAAIVGHSVGEVSAAYAAGMLSLKDAIKVSCHRGRIQGKAAGWGKMLAASLTEEEALARIAEHEGKVSIAAVNSFSSITLAGDPEALEQIAAQLESEGIFCRFLRVEVPYHSPAMDKLKPELREALAAVQPKPAFLPVYSTVTGERVEGLCYDAEYWCENIREPVLFAKTLEAVIADQYRVFLEVGPHPVLSTSIKETLIRTGVKAMVVPTLRRQEPEQLGLLSALATLYIAGTRIDWRKIYPHGALLDLPHYPWERQRYWAESNQALEDRVGSGNHPLLFRRVPAPNPVWESPLAREMLIYLEDHVVDGVVVLPGAAYIEAALALNDEFGGDTAQTVIGLKFHNALVIDELDEPVLRVEHEGARFQILSRSREPGSSWTLHATGELWSGEQPQPAHIDVKAIAERCTKELPVDPFYQTLKQRGLIYGPWFRSLRRLNKGENEILAEIEAYPDYAAESRHYRLHPTLLDACFQALFGILDDSDKNAFLPVEIERITVFQRPPALFWMHGELTHRSSSSITGDLRLFAADGTCIAEVRGLRCQALGSAGPTIDHEADQWMYQYAWREAQLEVNHRRNGNWMVIHGNDDQALSIVKQLAQSIQGKLVQVTPGKNYRLGADNNAVIDPDLADHFTRLLNNHAEVDSIAYVCDAQEATDDIASEVGRQTAHLLNLVNAAIQRDSGVKPRVFVITRGAQSALETDRLSGPAQWGNIGLSRVAYNEYRDLHCTLIDVGNGVDPSETANLVDELLSDGVDDDVALRGNSRFVHILQRTPLETLKRSGPKRPMRKVSSNRAYQVVRDEDSVFLEECVRKRPSPGEVEIENRSISLPDGSLGGTPSCPEQRTLRGFSGVISRVGDGVFDYAPGDAVSGCANIGLSPFETLQADSFISHIPHPADLSEAPLVAEIFAPLIYGLKHLARVETGDTVLIHGLGNRYAIAAARLSSALGAKILIASDDVIDDDLLKTLDCAALIKSSTVDFAERIEDLTNGRGVDVLLDFAESAFIRTLHRLVAPFGRIVNFHGSLPAGCLECAGNVSYMQVDIKELICERHTLADRLCAEAYGLIGQGLLEIGATHHYSCARLEEALWPDDASLLENRLLNFHDQSVVSVCPKSDDQKFITDSGSYLITGGFGGFGARIAHWLVDRGVRYLVLTGRRGANTDEGRRLITDLKRKGASVLSVTADVTRKEDVEHVLASIKSSFPPLHAVLHSAGVLDDAPLAELDRSRLDRVIAPKVQGAWNLHVATQHAELKHFILFSSVSALIGNSRQGNYVAANTFLDNLAQYRRDAGLAGVSVNWGAIADAGMAADSTDVEKHLELMGMKAFSAERALEAFNRAVKYQPVQIGIMDVSWYRWSQYEPAGGASPRFRHLVETEADSQTASGGESLRDHLAAVDRAARTEMLVLMLSEQIAETLRLPQDSFDPQRPLTDMGIDSLLGVELQTALNIKFGVDVSALELIKGNSTAQIAEIILRKFTFDDAAEGKPKTETSDAQQELPDMDALGEEELDALLQQLYDGTHS